MTTQIVTQNATQMVNPLAAFLFKDAESGIERNVRVLTGGNGDPLFVARDVADALGYSDTSQAVRTHCKRAKSLNELDPSLVRVSQNQGDMQLVLDPKTKLIPESDVYRLALRSTLKSAESFQDWVADDVIPSIRKTGSYSLALALPDFNDPVAAARAWADAEEGRRLEVQKNLVLTQLIDEERPFAEIGHLITGANTITRRDFVSILKDEHGLGIKEKQFTEFLLESGYCYRDAIDDCLRAKAPYAAYFKLEMENIRGVPRPVLKVTGEGVMKLTPVLRERFSVET